MPSANSFFNVALCKKQVKRFAPLWVFYTILQLILLPLSMYLKAPNAKLIGNQVLTDLHNHIISMSAHVAVGVAFISAIAMAMAVWSYLYNHRSVSMIHALPLSRGTLFFTNYLTGLAFLILPNLLAFLVGLAVQAGLGAVTMQTMLQWLLVQCGLNFIFFSFATLVAHVTGHILMLPVLYGVFSVLTKVVEGLVDTMLSTFVYGYSGDTIPVISWVGNWFAPLNALGFEGSRGLYALTSNGSNTVMLGGNELLQLHGLQTVGIYAVAALVMTVLAYLLYRRRKLELSGEVITVSFLRPIFKYGMAVCAGLAFSILFYSIVYGMRNMGYGNMGKIGPMLIALLVFAAIGYFAAEVMLRKTIHVLRKGAPGCLVLLVVLSVLMLGMEYDATGYERKLPVQGDIASVYISSGMLGRQPEYQDEDGIARTLAIHAALVEQKGETETMLSQLQVGGWATDSLFQNSSSFSIKFLYTMRDGSLFVRDYTLPVSNALLAQSDSPAALFDALINRQQDRMTQNFPVGVETAKLVDVSIEGPGELRTDRDGRSGYTSKTTKLSTQEAERLYAAVREDLEAGRIGRTFLLHNEEAGKINYAISIYFSFRGEYTRETIPNNFNYDSNYDSGTEPRPDAKIPAYYDCSISVQTTSTSTLQVLEALGLTAENGLQLEYDASLALYQGQMDAEATAEITS